VSTRRALEIYDETLREFTERNPDSQPPCVSCPATRALCAHLSEFDVSAKQKAAY
jgi:hypothetical protein